MSEFEYCGGPRFFLSHASNITCTTFSQSNRSSTAMIQVPQNTHLSDICFTRITDFEFKCNLESNSDTTWRLIRPCVRQRVETQTKEHYKHTSFSDKKKKENRGYLPSNMTEERAGLLLIDSSCSSADMWTRLPLIFKVSFDELEELSEIMLLRSREGDLSSTLSSFVSSANESLFTTDESTGASLSSAERT